MKDKRKLAREWLERVSPQLREGVFRHPSAGGRDFYSLAFYGDSILEVYIRKNLCEKYPQDDVGSLAKKRAILASTQSLAFLAGEWGLVDLLVYQEGEEPSYYTLASLTEAFVAAVAMTLGAGSAQAVVRFLDELFMPYWDVILRDFADYKSLAQEILNRNGQAFHYKLIEKEGPDHSPCYTVCLILDGKEVSRGKGKSIREAEQVAAEEFLTKI
ncbi:MAG: ribonuclease III family protein [Candidatus Hydrothermia bacterium]